MGIPSTLLLCKRYLMASRNTIKLDATKIILHDISADLPRSSTRAAQLTANSETTKIEPSARMRDNEEFPALYTFGEYDFPAINFQSP
ncbi:hypothetical protein [Cutibacterium avidum]|uniref:hypothetical protein n=1 Tax=Cutibacterium avidum TaxID=33010 RepID=UPI00117A1DA2|nr:hypothetical protein [Cutibacterium avidum]MDU7817148.1 hypothetical protein [Bacillota bacterium]